MPCIRSRRLLAFSSALVAAVVLAAGLGAKTVSGCKPKPNAHCAGKKLAWKLSFDGNLSGPTSARRSLAGPNLINANLWGATLSGTDLTNDNLENADLYGVVAAPTRRTSPALCSTRRT
jgi:Pentapeptide repeats (8 copies)